MCKKKAGIKSDKDSKLLKLLSAGKLVCFCKSQKHPETLLRPGQILHSAMPRKSSESQRGVSICCSLAKAGDLGI